MKTIILFLFVCLSNTIFFTQAIEPLFSYLGTFEFKGISTEKKVPIVPVYYKGQSIPVEKKSYIITDQKRFSSYTFIITLLDKPAKNTITCFSVPENKAYLLITITRKIKQYALKKGETFQETWIIKKIESIGPFTIPKDALIIVIDPTCVECIKNVSWQKDALVAQLPTIVFKEKLITSDAYNESLFASLDIRPFYGKIEEKSIKQTTKSESSLRIIT